MAFNFLGEENVIPENYVRSRVRIDNLGPSPVTLDRVNSDEQVVNTTTETALLEYTVPGGTLIGDRGLRVTLDFFGLNDSGGALDYTMRIYLGATELWDSGLLTLGDPGSATEYPGRLVFELMAKNSDAVQEIFGITPYNYVVFYGEATEDGTADLVLSVTVEMASADPDFEFTRRRYLIELL